MTITSRPIICIIDHDRDVRGLLRAQLAAADFATVEASDEQEGIQVVRQSGAALAIVNVVSALTCLQ